MYRFFFIIILIGISCTNHNNPIKDQKQNLSSEKTSALEDTSFNYPKVKGVFLVEDSSLYSPKFIKGLKEGGGYDSAELVGYKIHMKTKSYTGTQWITKNYNISIPNFILDSSELKYRPVKDSTGLELILKKKNISTIIYLFKNRDKSSQGEATLNSSFYLGSESFEDEHGIYTGGNDYTSSDSKIRLRIRDTGDLLSFISDTTILFKRIN